MKTFHIHIQGIVQGVGYRPFIHKYATEIGLNGYVANGSDGVHFVFNGDALMAEEIYNFIKINIPPKAKIFDVSILEIEQILFDDFLILESASNKDFGFISPDFAICESCKQEMLDPANRRYLYPFITCTSCGPRFSILKKLSYDRVNTTMSTFSMCSSCQAEYDDVNDVRYFSQTNSCHQCGIRITIKDTAGKAINISLQEIVQHILEGKIVAVKGIGGFLLMCDATNSLAIQNLRKKKNRPYKPLAILFENCEVLSNYCYLNPEEKDELKSTQAPIVILSIRTKGTLAMDDIAPSIDSIGAMLPNNGLLLLLSKYVERPMIATSANITGSPILYKDEEAEKELSCIYDFIVCHDREILLPQDDSVVRYSQFHLQKIILRRGRGYAPVFWKKIEKVNQEIIGCGAYLKSSISFAKQKSIYTSQFLGDQSTYESNEMYGQSFNHYSYLIEASPSLIVKDLHPTFQLESKIVEMNSKVKTIELQHHKAHFYSILLEHDLLKSKEPILGIIWDGIGYGEDGHIWGGEFFEYTDGHMKRINHADYFPYLLGDKMSLQPRIAAIAFCSNNDKLIHLIKPKFSDKEWLLYTKMLAVPQSVKTSSIGRIFDSVSSLLGICDINNFEGQAAMLLEQCATDYFKQHGLRSITEFYTFGINGSDINFQTFLSEIAHDLEVSLDTSYIAAKFHVSLILLIEQMAKPYKSLVFSGGVFQNALLIDLAIEYLSKRHELFFHQQLSPNDENISVGQVAYGMSFLKV
ncbi:MAG: Carbamoyltransferase HypF [Bacteroidota bacterium]